MIEKLGITPGPWVVTSDDQIRCNDEYEYPYEDGSREGLAMVWDGDHLKVGTKEANALLIAACPEMLEALIQAILNYKKISLHAVKYALPTKVCFCDAAIKCIDILEKATGKSWTEIKELL